MEYVINFLKNLVWILIFALSLYNNISYANSYSKKVLAITQIADNCSLEQAKEGILDALAKNNYFLGENLEIINKNAHGSIVTATLIAQQFQAINPDAIIAISTQSAQAIINAIHDREIPIVFSSVTDPVGIGLVSQLSTPTYNITGSIDSPLIPETVELIKLLVPNIKNIGFIYNGYEFNSNKTISLFKDYIKNTLHDSIGCVEVNVVNSSHVEQAFLSLIRKVDAIYIPSDNTVFSSIAKIVQLLRMYRIPVFSNDPDSVKNGIVACIGYSQYDVGWKAGQALVKILRGQSKIVIQKPEKVTFLINEKAINLFKLVIPKEIAGVSPKIVDKE